MNFNTAGDYHVHIYNTVRLVQCTTHYVDVKARGTCNKYSALKDESTVVTKFTTRINIQKLQILPQCLLL
jgi:hypothetical protein